MDVGLTWSQDCPVFDLLVFTGKGDLILNGGSILFVTKFITRFN